LLKSSKKVERVEPKNINNPFEEYVKLIEQAKACLEDSGYRIETDRGLSRDEVERLLEERLKAGIIEELSPEKLRARREGMGHRVVEPPRPWDDVERMVRETEKRSYGEALDEKQIEAAGELIKSAMSSMASMLGPPISQYMEKVIAGRGSNAASG
jgi:hypothetical protein